MTYVAVMAVGLAVWGVGAYLTYRFIKTAQAEREEMRRDIREWLAAWRRLDECGKDPRRESPLQ